MMSLFFSSLFRMAPKTFTFSLINLISGDHPLGLSFLFLDRAICLEALAVHLTISSRVQSPRSPVSSFFIIFSSRFFAPASPDLIVGMVFCPILVPCFSSGPVISISAIIGI